MPAGHQLEIADALEAAVAAHPVLPVAEDLEALVRQPGLVLVGVVHAHQRARLAGGPGGQVPPLHQHHALHPEPGQVKGRARSVHASADHDDVRSPVGHGI